MDRQAVPQQAIDEAALNAALLAVAVERAFRAERRRVRLAMLRQRARALGIDRGMVQ